MIPAPLPAVPFQFRLPLFIPDTRRLRLQLDRMVYGDALVSGGWEVEYVKDCGFPYFGVVYQKRIMGIVVVTAPTNLRAVCEWLAGFLAAQGWSVATGEFKPSGARTLWPERKSELKRLWKA